MLFFLGRRAVGAANEVAGLGGRGVVGRRLAVQPLRFRPGRPLAVDGCEDAGWVLLEFDWVLAHVFLPGERSYYHLENLWAPAAKA